jgi:hypothetical protein
MVLFCLEKRSSLVRFENKIISFALKNVLAYYSAGVVVVNSEVAFKVQGPML